MSEYEDDLLDDDEVYEQICPFCMSDMEFCTCDDGDIDEDTCPACGGTGVDKYDLLPCAECDGEGYLYWL